MILITTKYYHLINWLFSCEIVCSPSDANVFLTNTHFLSLPETEKRLYAVVIKSLSNCTVKVFNYTYLLGCFGLRIGFLKPPAVSVCEWQRFAQLLVLCRLLQTSAHFIQSLIYVFVWECDVSPVQSVKVLTALKSQLLLDLCESFKGPLVNWQCWFSCGFSR